MTMSDGVSVADAALRIALRWSTQAWRIWETIPEEARTNLLREMRLHIAKAYVDSCGGDDAAREIAVTCTAPDKSFELVFYAYLPEFPETVVCTSGEYNPAETTGMQLCH